ncbi:aldo/keto reductase [Nakamurella leprariae]|uniref:Aldo/keto reductase n=1 Tax=Nakamurella leprariae TaxID=2803911 RepID=A0A938Y9T5_9ACTN|nr:aldo/keto reductase [Nakamurella leprariae]MBM9465666.1 aldo/keto reductase [Nakamurella leprariae]
MITTELGDGLTVSALGFGGMSLTDMYGPVSDSDALRTLHHAVDSGITLLDTANGYGDGRSEITIGKLLKTRRDEIQLATKFGIVKNLGPSQRGVRGDREYVREQVELSLARLGTDRIDLYYQHRVDPAVPIEETVGAIKELIDEGKVLHIGLSEATGDEIRRAVTVHPIAAIQSEWSVVSRDVERWVVPAATEHGVGFVSYSTLGRKWLTGLLDADEFVAGDVRFNITRYNRTNLAYNQPVLDEFLAIARDADLTGAQLALAWFYDKGRRLGLPAVSIPGTRYPERVTENLGGLDVELSDDLVARLDALAVQVRGHRSAQPGSVSSARE